MTRSRKRKLRRLQAAWAGVPLASSMLVGAPPALAQQQAESGVLEEVVVTAQKRQESLQNVPVSITALGTAKLEEMHVTDFEDYAKLLPSVSFQSDGPGFAKVYMRGVSNGGDGNHSGSLPSVGMYLDEQPITTIQGNLDIHVYDIERIEALAGPQGTLYGASSQAGTVRIITNKPDPSGFKAGYDLQGNALAHGDAGYVAEGFLNQPISDKAAVRLVGWAQHDAGFIDNVAGSRQYPTSGICIANSSSAPLPANCSSVVITPGGPKNHYNGVDTYGARAALRIDLNDNWTISPTVMGQRTKGNGNFAFDSAVGDLKLTHFYPENSDDKWWQAALTVEGKMSNFDLVYAGAFLKRNDETNLDYTDYSFFYDTCCGYGVYFFNDQNALINPSQYIQGKDRYEKYSHELRLTSPQDWKFRFVAGLFMQRQQHGIEQRYRIDGLAASNEVTGWPDTFWLTEQLRVDRDYAFFTELSYDLTDKLTATGGIRFFKYENSLEGFYGFGLTNSYGSSTGEASCFSTVQVNGGPCMNLDKTVDDTGNTPKLNLTYRFDDRHMAYVTWAKGFRPGGINRSGALPPYTADFLTSYELGWKTTWADNRVRFNGAVFWEDWKNFQFSFLGPNSLTIIANAGNARIKGVEAEVDWAASNNFTLSGGIALLDAKLTENYCGQLDANGNPITTNPCPDPDNPPPATIPPLAPKDTQLPVTPKFKGNVTGRYTFGLGSFDGHVQGSVVYVGSRTPELRLIQSSILGEEEAYTLVDVAAGIAKKSYSFELFVSNLFDERAQVDRFAQCDATVCGLASRYILPAQPRMIGIKFGQRF
jgi:outer membrane receptor protein involved in Fe transport